MTTINKIEVNSFETLEALKDNSALTFTGLIADDENLQALFNWLNNYTEMIQNNVYIFKGNTMNNWLNLTGDNRYQNDLTFVSIKLDDIKNIQAIVLPRIQVGGRWLDDIVNNNLEREKQAM